MAALAAVLVIFGASSCASLRAGSAAVLVFSTPVAFSDSADKVFGVLDEAGIAYSVDKTGLLWVQDEETARKARALLITQNVLPAAGGWDFLEVSDWSVTDFERSAKRNAALRKSVKEYLAGLQGVVGVDVVIAFNNSLFADEKPVSAAVALVLKSGRAPAELETTVRNILLHSVPGLKEENITLVIEGE